MRLTRKEAEAKIIQDNEPEIRHLMGMETYTEYDSVEDSIHALRGTKEFKSGKTTIDKYGNRTIHMVRVK